MPDLDEDGFTVRIPDDIPDEQRDAYLRGLYDMAEYLQHVGATAQQAYLQAIDDGPADDQPTCETCGAVLSYNPATGERYCTEC